MKKKLSKLLAVFIAVLCFSFCFFASCGEPKNENVVKLEKSYSDVNEVVDVLVSMKESVGFSNTLGDAIKHNKTISVYFQAEESSTEIYKLLYDKGMNYNTIAYLYSICSEDDWYNYIATEGADDYKYPFLLRHDGPRKKDVVESIKSSFKDPESVSITESYVFFKGVEEGAKRFKSPIRYKIYVKVRATNSFGAYVTGEYIVDGTSNNIFYLSEEYDFLDLALLKIQMKSLGYYCSGILM